MGPSIPVSSAVLPPLAVALSLFGACIGSFLNVVVWRLPRHESLIRPGSHCPNCGHAVRWHDNIPLLGWLLLRGRCRDCGWSIPWRYPMTEALCSGLWFTAAWAQGGAAGSLLPLRDVAGTLQLLAGLGLVSLLLVLTLIDCDHLWLPEPLCRWGAILGLMVTFAVATPERCIHHLLAAAAALLVMESVSALAERLLGQPALGLGDAKLAALGGAWLGLSGIAAAMAVAVCSGALFGVTGRISGHLSARQPFPFGPFIALGIWLIWLTGPLWWWQNWMRLVGAV
mgnify:CR=1 FL=1|jgi:leader peptidase (prepilin peptidase)/N-methyltransferase